MRINRADGPAPEDLTARARIRDAALQHFAESGFAKTTIREIARTAQVSPGLVRHHFGSKEELRSACDMYVLEALHRVNDKALRGRGDAEPPISDRHALNPYQRYLVSALMDDSSVAAPMFDEMVKMLDGWLAHADAERPDPPTVDRTTRAALMVAQSLGIATFHKHISRFMGVDLLSEEGDRKAALAMLDIYSHSLVSAEYAASTRKSLAQEPDGSPTRSDSPSARGTTTKEGTHMTTEEQSRD
ncbi:TetR/AcrR family transcriptional regulator [Streptomyces sp. NPDC087844]|uniref:TetR/AcrR family transcriptional regulator n=1 Tax=Streptomyces sp. NPDC087844 TaxID=3365805 RepID=UPI003802B2A1